MRSLERGEGPKDRDVTSFLDSGEVMSAMRDRTPYVLDPGTVVDIKFHRHGKNEVFGKPDIRGVTLDAPVEVYPFATSKGPLSTGLFKRNNEETREYVEFSLDSPEQRQASELL